MYQLKDLFQKKNSNNHELSKTIKDILQVFLHAEKGTGIQDAMSVALDFFHADRIYIGYLNEDDPTFSLIYEKTTDGILSFTSYMNRKLKRSNCFKEDDLPCLIGNLKSDIDIVINDIDETPYELIADFNFIREAGTQSFLSTSIFRDGEICGFLCLECVKRKHTWQLPDIENAHFFADIFSIFIENEQIHREIENSAFEAFKNDTIFRIMFDTLPVGIELYDEKGYLRKINPYDLKILGTTEEEALGLNLFENPNIKQESKEQLRKGEPAEFEDDYDFSLVKEAGYFPSIHGEKVIRLIGKCIPLKDKSGNVFGYLELVHHDTSYYKTKEDLRVSLTKLQMAANARDSFFWEYDVKNDKISIDFTLMNEDQQHYLRLIQKGNPLNKANNLSLVHPEDEGYMAEKINLLLEGKIDSFTETYRKYVDGDDLRWFNTSVRTYSYDQDGKAEIVVCLTTDVTEIRKKDIELFEIKEADKIKTAFIKSMSHEIRTPLNVIVGFSKVMADNNDTEENRQFFDAIQANNEILLRIIDSILSLTKSETGAIQYMKECVDIKDICRSAFSLKSASRKPHLEFVFDENQPSILVNTDSEHIKQALYHLLDNANKYTNQGHVKLSYYQCNEDEVRVEIIDSGIGLTQQEIDKIFQHFYKRDHFQLGVGLGLSISKKFIEDLGGKLGVDSEKGKGSNFWFTLPLAKMN